ncbi:hypothetical protein L208DRAFT_1392745 [Tricholoma matsutake]|nr:hypothetical protein L208DRAFT_1392745 [Tricholoma matsutake 945]
MLPYFRSVSLAPCVKPTLQFWANGIQSFSSSTSSPSLELQKPLCGTVQSHRSSIFLHTAEPPATFPARLSTPIWRALQLKASKWGGIVNFCWLGHKLRSAGQSQSATAFSALGGRLEIPEITLENLDEVGEKLRRHAEGTLVESVAEELHLYVCTHGARDCRCGTIGRDVVKVLREEVNERMKRDPDGLVKRIQIGEIGHVGGHQYAANLLIFPHGEWLGFLKPDDVPAVLSTILHDNAKPFNKDRPPLCPPHWRGRMGLSKDEQLHLFSTYLTPDRIAPT